ncbi:MAG TPA: hypothetical protein ENK26_07365, partial [Gammaproteobacteria bacterium]|nr:hypothetical protein [Gammaproteobacteria bacterium]
MSRDISEWLKPDKHSQPGAQPRPVPFMAEQDVLDVGQIISLLLGNKWLIAGFLLIAGLIGWLVSFNMTPLYRVDATLQVEKQSSSLPGLEEVSEFLESSSSSPTTIELVSSRSNLGQVVDALNLRISVTPERLPVIGQGLALRYQGKGPTGPPAFLANFVEHWLPASLAKKANLDRYNWGGEAIRVERFDVNDRETVDNWTIEAAQQGAFRLLDETGRPVLSGIAGASQRVHDARHGDVSIFVSQLAASPGARFQLSKLDRLSAIAQLKERLKVKEKGKKTGIIELSMNHADRALAIKILDAISNTYLRRDVERKSQEAQQMLAFIERQLPTLKANL